MEAKMVKQIRRDQEHNQPLLATAYSRARTASFDMKTNQITGELE